MSVKRACLAGRVLLACVLAISVEKSFAHGDSSSDVLPAPSADGAQRNTLSSPEYPYLLVDPLRSRPGRLESDEPLPGDTTAIDCAATGAPTTQPLSLAAAVDLALCHSPQVQASWAAIKIQAAGLGQARAAWLPTANATLSRLHSQTIYPKFSASNTSSTGDTAYAGLTWRLFDFGARSADSESAARLLDAALANHDATLQKTLSAVVQAYFDAVSGHAAVRSRADATRYAQETLDATQRREAKGAAPVSDTLQARAALAKARLAEQRAIGDLHKSLAILSYSCGLTAGAEIDVVEDAPSEPEQAVADLDLWLEMVSSRHPAILAAHAQVSAAVAKVGVARAQGLPSIDFSANYYRNGYPNQGLQPTNSSTRTVGITLNIPLFEGLARTYQIRSAQAQVEQSQAQLQDTQLQLASTLVKDHADATAALANLDASATWATASVAAVDSARKRYDKGAGDVLELLAAQASMADAQQERVRCLSEWRAAKLRLFADAGLLGRQEVARSGAPVITN